MVQERGGTAVVHQCDATDPEQAKTVIDEVHAEWGRIDILFNNVGIAGPAGTVVDVDLEAWDRACPATSRRY